MEDERIIELYWNRDQRAIRETDGKYGKLRSEEHTSELQSLSVIS